MPAPPPARLRRPLWQRWWVITPAVLVALFVLLGLVGSLAPIDDEALAPAAEADPADYDELGERDFALIVRSPDDHRGEQIIVYGRVTQFDAATGRAQFRADTTAVRDELDDFFFGQNTYMRGDEGALADVVEDDLFRAHVTVMGARTYRTAIGGRMTVPEFRVDLIEVLDP